MGSADLSTSFHSNRVVDISQDSVDSGGGTRQSSEPDQRAAVPLMESAASKIGETPTRSPSSISDNSNSRYSPKTAGVKRSESAKDGDHRKNPRRGGVRKHSDPNLGPSRSQARIAWMGRQSPSQEAPAAPA